jgi:hypothetical protein
MVRGLTCTLTDLRFCTSSADPGVFVAKVDKHILIFAINVDDRTLTGSLPELIAEYKRNFNNRYTATDLGPIHWFLGIRITRDCSARTTATATGTDDYDSMNFEGAEVAVTLLSALTFTFDISFNGGWWW